LDIGNATLRVGKLEVAETTGLNQGLQNIVKNDLLITESTTYTSSQHWGLKLPTTWVAEFDLKGETGKYVEFNFYNEGFTSNTSGYTLNFTDTSLTLKYDNGSTLASATIPTIVGTFRKVHIFFERNVIAVSIDGTRYLYDKRPSVLSRVISTTGSAFLNLFVEDNSNASLVAFKNLRVVNGRFISDETSNIAFVGGNLGVGVHSPTESLDVLGSIKTRANVHVTGNVYAEGEIELYSNLNIQHVSNTSTIKANSNVVTEFPRSKKLIKYPRVALTQNALNNEYTVIQSGTNGNEHRKAWSLFNNDVATDDQYHAVPASGESNPYNPNTGAYEPDAGFEDGLGDVAGEYVYVVMPDKIKLQGVSVHPRDGALARSAESARFMGSNDDGTTWIDLGGYANYVWGAGSQEPGNFFTVDSNEYYNYIGVVWTKVKGGSGGDTVNMAEVQFFGVPEYDPEAHGTDVTVKSYPNVPNTDWLEVYYDAKDLANYTLSGSDVTDVLDLSSQNRNSTATNVTIDSTWNAFRFSGSGSETKIEDFTISGGDYIHSMSLWVNSDEDYTDLVSPDSRKFFFLGADVTTGSAASHGISGLLFDHTGYLKWYHWSNDTYYNIKLNKNEWYHVTLVYKGNTTNTQEVYVNAKRIDPMSGGSSSSAISLPTTIDLFLGRGRTASKNAFKGMIANFRLFNRAITSDEVWQLYSYQKEYFGHGDLSMTLKAGRLGIGTLEPRAALDVQGPVRIYDTELTNPVFAEFATNYSSTGFSDEQSSNSHWRDPTNNILDFNEVTLQSSHNAFDADSAVGVRGSFTAPVDGLYVVNYAALINRYSTSSHIYVYVNGSNANDTGINSHQNRNTTGSMWTTLTIQRVTRLKRGDKVQCYITGGFYTLGYYSFGSIYQIGA
jgi:hypothetical protein